MMPSERSSLGVKTCSAWKNPAALLRCNLPLFSEFYTTPSLPNRRPTSGLHPDRTVRASPDNGCSNRGEASHECPLARALLDSSSLELKEKAVAAISIISTVDGVKNVMIAEGIVLLNHLLRILDSGSGFAKEKSCLALQSLSISKQNARSIGSRGGISSLLEICEAGTPGSQASAAAVLRNLASFNEIKENFIEENGVIVLLGLLTSGTPLAQENAIGCLCNLVGDDDNLKLLIVKEGGIEFLKIFWDSVPSVRSLEVAVELLSLLASCSPIAETLISEGFLDRLLPVLSCGVLGARIAAARAVHELSFCAKARKEMGESGFITPLINMLDGKSVDEKTAAAKALSSLLQYNGNRRIFQKEERGIVSAVHLLDPSILNLDKKYPVSLLASVVISSKCRKLMAAAGAASYLQKLVEMNVEGSKKLLVSLSRAKIWGVFARS
ncbi:U-box domain-containing protein 4, partial [Cucurbita argyrosperma subsp. argyrosperma]